MYTENFDHKAAGFLLICTRRAPWLPMFKALYSAPHHRGMVDGKYNYRFDAVKFAHKIAAIGAAAESDDCDVLLWIDADVITHAQVTTEWLDRLLPLSATIAMIEREKKYPECGFMMFRLPAARKVIRQIVTCTARERSSISTRPTIAS